MMIKITPAPVKLSLFLLPCFLLVFLLNSCKEYHRNRTHKNVPLSSIEKGESLAETYCQSCHMLPDPSLVDTKSWETGVLPQMGPRLGIFNLGFERYPTVRDKNIGPGFYPAQPMLNVAEWQNIFDYFVATSPDSLPGQNRKDLIKEDLSLFKAEIPAFNYTEATTCYVKINQGDSLYPVIISDAKKKNIYFINRSLQVVDSIHTTGPVVDIDFSSNRSLACN